VRTHFARAVDLGDTNPRLHYDYSVVVRDLNEKSTAAIPLLKKAVELDPATRMLTTTSHFAFSRIASIRRLSTT
jgi:hypothetical protein